MLFTIHNLPTRTQYSDVKHLIISECGLEESILDNLQNEGNGMQVTVGVAEKEDAAILVRKINGLYYRGQQLFVEDKSLRKTGVQNTYMAYGGQQTQPQQLMSLHTGAFNEFIQQPYAPSVQQNPEPAGLYDRRSPCPERHRSTEDGRSGCDDRLRGGSPPAFAPWASHGQDEPPQLPDYEDPHGVRNERPKYSRGFGPKDMYENRGPRQHDDSRGFNAYNSRGGHFSNPRDLRGGHSSNSRDMRGGHSLNSRDMHAGYSPMSRDMRGGHSSNSRDMRGGYSSKSRDMRGGHSWTSREMHGGYASHAHESRSEPTPNPHEMRGDNSPDMRDKCPKNAQKRPWVERTARFKRVFDRPTHGNWREQPTTQRQSRPLHRKEPKSKIFAPQQVRNFDGYNAGLVSKPVGYDVANLSKSTEKVLKSSQVKGVNEILFTIATHLNIQTEFERRSLIKTQIRRIINTRVTDMLTGVIEALPPDEFVARYRARYPESDDFNIYKSVTQIHADAGPETIKQEIKRHQEKDMACDINATTQRAIDEELDREIGALLEDSFKNPQSQDEQMVFSEIDQEECINQCKKLVTSLISERITNSGPKQVRILARPKAPRRCTIVLFLSKYRCLTLKKSRRCPSYLATFNSYDAVDELCKMKSVEIGDPKVLLVFNNPTVAPDKKILKESRANSDRKKYVLRLIENSKVNLLDKDWKIVEEEERKAKAESNSVAESDDVIYLGRQGVTEIDITDDAEVLLANQNTAETNRQVSAAASEYNHDFSHVDLKVIDKVSESDNDKVPHDAPHKGDRRLIYTKEKNEVKDDWDETGENWEDIDDKRNTGEDDSDAKVSIDFVVDAKLNKNENVGDIDAADIDWADVNEDDLEDY